jgi:hypothetical protein
MPGKGESLRDEMIRGWEQASAQRLPRVESRLSGPAVVISALRARGC